MTHKVRTIDHFDRLVKRLAKKHRSLGADLQALFDSLKENPIQGISLGKGCYKLRMAITGKGQGKSGGARVISCVIAVDEVVTLLSIYDKSEQADISDAFLLQLLEENGLV